MSKELANRIREQAIALGYESCGIVRVSDMNGYAEKLQERIDRFPELAPLFQPFFAFAYPEKRAPWAKSVVVCVRRYGKYRIPETLKGLIGKYYLVDSRTDANAAEYQSSIDFEQFLTASGMQAVTSRSFGVTALRWAAMQAGLGIVRKNNFFYTKSGSWVYLEAWLIDQELEWKEESTLKPCPDDCDQCRKACPTKCLASPFAMNRAGCVTQITALNRKDMREEPENSRLGNWIYGCDACQDACPFNKGAWADQDEYPKLEELATIIDLEKIVEMDYNTLRDILAPKFWYIKKEDAWKFKTNALNAMVNSKDEKYLSCIQRACSDEQETVRNTAIWALQVLSSPDSD